jgi:adenylate cyclase
VPVAAVVAGLLIYLYDPLPLQVMRNAVFDQYQRWAPRSYNSNAPVHIIDIDDASLAKLGQWPWPRTRIAELVQRLQAAGAAAIVFDVMFAEPDRTSPAAMAKLWHLDPQQRAVLGGLPDNDAVLAAAIARGGVVLGHAPTRQGHTPPTFVQPYRVIDLGPSPLPYLSEFKGSVAALPNLQKAAAGNGAITFVPDSDGVVRRVPMLLRLGDQVVPSLAAEALRVAQNEQNYLVKTSTEAGVGIEEVRVGALTVPTTAQGEVWVHYTSPVPSRYIPAWKVLAGEVPEASLSNQILLIGSSAQGLMDLRFSPLGGTMPGVEAHAQALEQILVGDRLVRPNWASGLEVLEIIVGGLFVGFVGISVGALLSAVAAATVLLATCVWGWYGYSDYGLLLDPVVPSLSTLLIFILSSVYHHAASERRQRWVRRAFSRYVSPNLVSHLVDNPGQLELGGRRRECSFIFTDLAGFTNLMEKLDPTEAVSLLNDYLDNMVKIAFKHEGTLDRIVGDAVAIMFSAPVEQPDHRQRALDCAREMHRFARRHAAEANARGVPFGQTRIGIHTGEVTVGNFGGSTIFDYRALGDPVNTAARLESVNKQLGTVVCVSEATLAGCTGAMARPVGKLVLKGKTEPLMVYEPAFAAGGDDQADSEYEAAYRRMAAGETDALAAFERLAAERPKDTLVAFQLARLRRGQSGDLIVFTEK